MLAPLSTLDPPLLWIGFPGPFTLNRPRAVTAGAREAIEPADNYQPSGKRPDETRLTPAKRNNHLIQRVIVWMVRGNFDRKAQRSSTCLHRISNQVMPQRRASNGERYADSNNRFIAPMATA